MLFRRTSAREFAADLFELAPDGKIRTLATAGDLLGTGNEQLDAERACRERTRTVTRGIVDTMSRRRRDRDDLLGGKLYLIDRATGARASSIRGGAADDPHLSPDGKLIAFVRDADVWVVGAIGRRGG